MAILGFTVNASDLPEDNAGDYSPVPAGEYDVEIKDAEIRTTKSGTGQYIAMRLDIVAPSHEGRVVWANLNIKNDSQKAEEIGRQQLGSVMRAIGLASLQDTDQLIGGRLGVKLAIRKSEEYGDSNEVKAFKAPKSGASAGAPAPAMASAPAAAAPPWARK